MDNFAEDWLQLKQDKSVLPYDRAVKVLAFNMMDRDKFINEVSQLLPLMKEEGIPPTVEAIKSTFEPYVRQRLLLNLAASLMEQGNPLPQNLAVIIASYLRGKLPLMSAGKNKTQVRDSALAQAVYDVVEAHDICPTRNPVSRSGVDCGCGIVLHAYNDHYTPLISMDVVEHAWKKRSTIL